MRLDGPQSSVSNPLSPTRAALVALFILTALCPPNAFAQPASIPSRIEIVEIDSGVVRNLGETEAVIWATVVEVPQAVWLRLSFHTAIFGEDPHDGGSSTLVLTSLEDGASQHLNIRAPQLNVDWFAAVNQGRAKY